MCNSTVDDCTKNLSITVDLYRIKEYYITCAFSTFFAFSGVLISLIILLVIYRGKSRLHTIRHLLICNTSVASILYCFVQVMNYMFLLFLQAETSDLACRWRGYLSYLSICSIVYSYVIQAVSRLFISILSASHRSLVTYRTHRYLILAQWILAFVIPLPSLITKDIYFRPYALCWVPMKSFMHVIYTFIMYYSIPVSVIFTIYSFIYYRIRQTRKREAISVRMSHTNKRDLQFLRNIILLLGIYLSGGIPTMLFLITSNRVLYLMGLVTISFTLSLEKVCTIILDRDVRKATRTVFMRSLRIEPIEPAGQRMTLKRLDCRVYERDRYPVF